jgi:hypothetical protein
MRCLLAGGVVLLLAGAVVPPIDAADVVFGYGQELRSNRDLEQYELAWRQELAWGGNLTATLPRQLAVETGIGLIRDRSWDESPTFRLSLVPQLLLVPHPAWRLIVGFGPGMMFGETNFDDNNLGGPFFLASKLGVQLRLNEWFGVEYLFYHQSNAGIYGHNAGLNMHHLAIAFFF